MLHRKQPLGTGIESQLEYGKWEGVLRALKGTGQRPASPGGVRGSRALQAVQHPASAGSRHRAVRL